MKRLLVFATLALLGCNSNDPNNQSQAQASAVLATSTGKPLLSTWTEADGRVVPNLDLSQMRIGSNSFSSQATFSVYMGPGVNHQATVQCQRTAIIDGNNEAGTIVLGTSTTAATDGNGCLGLENTNCMTQAENACATYFPNGGYSYQNDGEILQLCDHSGDLCYYLQ